MLNFSLYYWHCSESNIKVERKKKDHQVKKKADREGDGIKQNSFLIKQSNKITVEKKAERNENLKAAEK